VIANDNEYSYGVIVESNPGIQYGLFDSANASENQNRKTAMIFDDVRARERMVQEQLVVRGIRDPRVLWAMARVPRHLFVENELWDHAYDDRPLPIGADQTISQPYMVALTVEALELKGTERVLEVGTGSGYAAAVLAELCAEVFSVEAVEELALKARANLTSVGHTNVSVLAGDGTLGWEEHAPYDAVVISAAAPCIPRPLLEQLRTPGYLVLPMGEKELQTLVRIRKDREGIREEYLAECRFVKLTGRYGWEDMG
jgi:protein-L-isoaspartate(D-aspartate) O-methyltransferase